MRVCFLTVDWVLPPGAAPSNIYTRPDKPEIGGSGFYRCMLPAWALGYYGGHEVGCFGDMKMASTGEICPVDWWGNLSEGWDVIVLQRWMHAQASDIIAKARAMGQVVIQDVDDWYWGLDTKNRAFLASHPKTNAELNRNHYHRSLAASSKIIYSTPYLAGRMARLNVPSTVVDNMVMLDMFPRQEVTDSRHPNLGWVGGTPWRSGDLEVLSGFLGRFMDRHDLHFLHGGHTPEGEAARMMKLSPGRACVQPTMPIARYPLLFEGIEVGLVPLRDFPFNHAKSALKGKEFSASGIPFIATPTESYQDWGAGLLAQRTKDWLRHLERLMDPAERRKVADAAYERVSLDDCSKRWADWAKALDLPAVPAGQRAPVMLNPLACPSDIEGAING